MADNLNGTTFRLNSLVIKHSFPEIIFNSSHLFVIATITNLFI